MIRKPGRPIKVASQLDELAIKVGGVQQLANEVGVDVRTVRYWSKKDYKPSGAARSFLKGLQKHTE